MQIFTGKEILVMDAKEYLGSNFRPCFESPFENDERKEENEEK